MRKKDRECEWVEHCGSAPGAKQCVALIIRPDMIKAARKIVANAELARAFADIFRAPTHEEVAVLRMLFAQNERIPNEWAALRERPWRAAMRRFNHD